MKKTRWVRCRFLPAPIMARRRSAPCSTFPISGMKPYPAFVWSMALIKRAAAEVHRDLGLLDEKMANAIIQAADEVLAGKLQRSVRGRSVSGGRGHEPQHEHQRSDRQPRQRNPRLRAGRPEEAGQPERSRQYGAEHQRHHPDGDPARRALAAGRTDRRRCTGWPTRSRRRRRTGTTSSRAGARTCRMPFRCGWGRNLARMPKRSSATSRKLSRLPKGCAVWGSAARRPARA